MKFTWEISNKQKKKFSWCRTGVRFRSIHLLRHKNFRKKKIVSCLLCIFCCHLVGNCVGDFSCYYHHHVFVEHLFHLAFKFKWFRQVYWHVQMYISHYSNTLFKWIRSTSARDKKSQKKMLKRKIRNNYKLKILIQSKRIRTVVSVIRTDVPHKMKMNEVVRVHYEAQRKHSSSIFFHIFCFVHHFSCNF